MSLSMRSKNVPATFWWPHTSTFSMRHALERFKPAGSHHLPTNSGLVSNLAMPLNVFHSSGDRCRLRLPTLI